MSAHMQQYRKHRQEDRGRQEDEEQIIISVWIFTCVYFLHISCFLCGWDDGFEYLQSPVLLLGVEIKPATYKLQQTEKIILLLWFILLPQKNTF